MPNDIAYRARVAELRRMQTAAAAAITRSDDPRLRDKAQQDLAFVASSALQLASELLDERRSGAATMTEASNRPIRRAGP
jgi:hypothetical protein